MGRASLTWLAAPVASSADISILVDCGTSLGFECDGHLGGEQVLFEDVLKSRRRKRREGGGGKHGQVGGQEHPWAIGRTWGKRGGDVGEEEAGDEVGGELGVVGSLLLVGVFELSRESMQKLEGSFSNLVLNSL